MSGSNPNALHPAYNPRVRTSAAMRIFAVSVLVTAALYVVPFGRTIAWPLVLISTLAHELGHGLAAALLGGQFRALYIYRDASGAALWSGAFGRVAVATVAAAGLIGPAIAAFVLLVVGRQPRRARTLLGILGVSLFVIALLVVRNPFGVVFTLLLGSVLLLVALSVPRRLSERRHPARRAARAVGVFAQRLLVHAHGTHHGWAQAVRRRRDGASVVPAVLVLGRGVRSVVGRDPMGGREDFLPLTADRGRRQVRLKPDATDDGAAEAGRYRRWCG